MMASTTEDHMMECSTKDDQASSGQLATLSKGVSGQGATNGDELEPPMDTQQVHRESDEPINGSDQVPAKASVEVLLHRSHLHHVSPNGNRSNRMNPQGPSRQGATNSDELEKRSPDPPMAAQQVHPDSGGPVPGSDHYPVRASVKRLTSSEVLHELETAAETLLKYHYLRDEDPKINKFYNNLEKDFTKSAAGSQKTPSSHAAAGTVKIHKIVTGETFGADTALLNKVSCKELQVEMTDRQGCDIIVLFCPIKFRVGSDVELAMSQVSDEEQVILILMHHTRDVDYSTAAKRWSETFQNVVFDVNVLYHETVPGLLKCPKNTEAIKDIQNVLLSYSHSSSSSKYKCCVC